MNVKKLLFRYQLQILCSFGYQLTYDDNWKGILIHLWGYINWAALFVGAVCAYHGFISNVNNIIFFTESLSSALNWTMCFIRVTDMFMRRKRLSKLVQELRDYTDARLTFAAEEFEKTTLQSENLSKLDMLLIGTSMSNLLVKSFYLIVIKKLRVFPFRISFFFDLKQPIVFEIFCVLCWILGISIAVTSLGPVTLIYALCNNIKAHFRYLHKRIKTMDMTQSEERLRPQINKFIRNQQQIENWIIELNSIYMPITNAMSVYYALLICNIGFQVVVTHDPIKLVQQFFYVIAGIFTLFLYMLAGDQIRLESMHLADAIWESDWYNAPMSIKKDLLFVIRRCKKPFMIKGLFFEISLDTFTSIMNAAGSYVALLMNFLD